MQLSSEHAFALARVVTSFHRYLLRLKGRMEDTGLSQPGRYLLIYERVCRADEVLRDLVALLNYETLHYVGRPPKEENRRAPNSNPDCKLPPEAGP